MVAERCLRRDLSRLRALGQAPQQPALEAGQTPAQGLLPSVPSQREPWLASPLGPLPLPCGPPLSGIMSSLPFLS